MDFENNLSDIMTYHEPEGIDSVSCNLTVKWSFEMEVRNWGLKGCSITVQDIEGSLFYEYLEDGRKEEEVDIKSLGFEVEAEGIDDIKLSDSVCPQSVEINYRDKVIFINF